MEHNRIRAQVTNRGQIARVRPVAFAHQRRSLQVAGAARNRHRDGQVQRGKPQRGERYGSSRVGTAGLIPHRRALGRRHPGAGGASQCDDLEIFCVWLFRARLSLAHPAESSAVPAWPSPVGAVRSTVTVPIRLRRPARLSAVSRSPATVATDPAIGTRPLLGQQAAHRLHVLGVNDHAEQLRELLDR